MTLRELYEAIEVLGEDPNDFELFGVMYPTSEEYSIDLDWGLRISVDEKRVKFYEG